MNRRNKSKDSKISFCDLGILQYKKSWEIQKRVHVEVVSGDRSATILAVEHPSVLTLGKNSDPSNIKTSKVELERLGISVEVIDRGGEVTAHMPGQIVIYPIFNLPEAGLGAKAYVSALEMAVIATLSEFGISASTDPINSGVWVKKSKICAIGIRISKRVSLHGIGLNFDNDLRVFGHIVPCGILGRDVTNVVSESAVKFEKSKFKCRLIEVLTNALGFSGYTEFSKNKLMEEFD